MSDRLHRIVAIFYHMTERQMAISVALIAFTLLAATIALRGHVPFDSAVLTWLNSFSSSWLDGLMLGITRFGYPYGFFGVLAIAIVILYWQSRWRDLAFLAIAALFSAPLNSLIKLLFDRPRPDLWLSIAPETDSSFPSGHTMLTASLFLALTALAWQSRWRWPVLACSSLVIGLVALSRLYLGVHFPSDVVAGAAAAVVWVGFLYTIWYNKNRKIKCETKNTKQT